MQEHSAPVFMVATANDIDALPPELLRKGRFDEIFFVDLPDSEARSMIFAIHLRKRARDPKKFDLDLLSHAADGYSGAEIEQAILSALQSSFSTRAELTTDAIKHAIEESPPLSRVMAERVNGLRRWADGRCVPAD
jgi:SpoVK/Ycf46/Vps4 family AAA+-type ATPase